jgi:type IV pilus assembly protein PilM
MSLSPFKKEKYIGLDIGHYAIKAAQIERTASSLRVTGVGYVPTPADSVNDGVVTDPQAVGDAIRQLLREFRLGATTANVAVAGGTVVVRTVKMPMMPEAALRKSIRFEAGRYVPSSVEDSYIECEILGTLDDGQMEVLVAASPRDMVESRVKAAEAAGLDVEVVDIEGFAAHRSLVEYDDHSSAPDHVVALVDIGGSSTHVSVIDQGLFALTRSIPIGGHHMTSALETYFKLSKTEAEEGKRALDLTPLVAADGPMENAPLRVIQPLADELIREIRRSLNYFQSQQSGGEATRNVGELILFGGASMLGGLTNYIGHKLGIPTSVKTPFDNPRFVLDDTSAPCDPRELAVALGLAMRRTGKETVAA